MGEPVLQPLQLKELLFVVRLAAGVNPAAPPGIDVDQFGDVEKRETDDVLAGVAPDVCGADLHTIPFPNLLDPVVRLEQRATIDDHGPIRRRGRNSRIHRAHGREHVGVLVADHQPAAGATRDLEEGQQPLHVARAEVGHDEFTFRGLYRLKAGRERVFFCCTRPAVDVRPLADQGDRVQRLRRLYEGIGGGPVLAVAAQVAGVNDPAGRGLDRDRRRAVDRMIDREVAHG